MRRLAQHPVLTLRSDDRVDGQVLNRANGDQGLVVLRATGVQKDVEWGK